VGRSEEVVNLFQGCSGRNLAHGLQWLREPPSWGFSSGTLEIVAEAGTDFFRPPIGEAHDNACLLYTRVRGDFTALADARAVLAGFGDAGALTVRSSPTRWAKICIERSPRGEVSIVSVVTDLTSDDSNNELLSGPSASLRLTRQGQVFAMHYRADQGPWRFVRTFDLPMPEDVMVGVHAQAPFVAGCRVLFDRFEIEPGAVRDFRSGE
jgi:regulation of enolase protein 1 (concanavalin A-like superfamily)